jgi:hypothetical protein
LEDPRAGLDDLEKRTFFTLPGLELRSLRHAARTFIVAYYRFTSSQAIAEAVSRRLPTAAARVWQMGFVVDIVPSGQVFSEYFGFPAKTVHSTNFSILTITWGLAAVPNGPSMDFTHHYANKRNK